MLHVMQSAGRATSNDVLRAMFAARKRVFVDLLRWDVPVLDGLYEVDQFDNSHAVYLVLVDEAGRHLGSARLLPTVRPHILDSLFPKLCEGAIPRGRAIFEITRFCLDRRLTASERRAVRDSLVCALVEHALAHGIATFTAIAELGWVQQILSFGWRSRPLGLPCVAGGAALAALAIEITAETPELLTAAGILPDLSVLDAVQREAA